MKKLMPACVCALLLLASLPVLADGIPLFDRASIAGGKQQTTVDFELNGHIMLVKARLGNSAKTYTFALDTGSSFNVVDARIANNIKKWKLDDNTVKDSYNAAGKFSYYLTDSLSTGDCLETNVILVATDLSRLSRMIGRKIDGLLGDNYLRHYCLTIDYAKRHVTFSLGKPAQEIIPANAIKFQMGARDYFNCFFIPIRFAGKQFFAVLDTGSYDDKVPRDILEGLNYPRAEKLTSQGAISSGLFASLAHTDMLVRLDEVTIGKTFHRFPVSSLENSSACLIGYCFLSQFLVTIDYPHNTAIFVPRADAHFPDNLFRTGEGLKRNDKGEFFVTGFYPGAPADQAGLRIGDIVQEINGTPTRNITYTDLLQLMTDDTVKTLTYTVSSNGVIRKVTVVKTYLFPKE